MGIIQHGANPVADLAGGIGDFLPDRGQHSDDISTADAARRHVTQLRKGIVFETGEPLARIDRAFPARFVFAVVLSRGSAERHLGSGLVFFLGQNIAVVDL